MNSMKKKNIENQMTLDCPQPLWMSVDLVMVFDEIHMKSRLILIQRNGECMITA